MVEVARWAPSGFHTQRGNSVVGKEPERSDRQSSQRPRVPAIRNRPETKVRLFAPDGFRDAPFFIILLVDWRAKFGLPGHPKEKNPIVTDLPIQARFLYFAFGPATSFGLASQWYTAASRPNAESAIRKSHRHTRMLFHIRHVGARVSGGKRPRSQGTTTWTR